MAKISTYPVVSPEGSDIIVGSDTGSSNSTKNFTAQSIADLYVEVPNTLQQVLDAGNSATNNIILEGDVELNRLTLLDGPAVADVGQMGWNPEDGTANLRLSEHKDLGISSLAATSINCLGYEAPADYDPSIVDLG